MNKKFNEWHQQKVNLHNSQKNIRFKERDIFWASIGVNIGSEQDGKGKKMTRPVIIVKAYSKSLFLGVPLSTQIKDGSFFFEFVFEENSSNALLVQARTFDTKRLGKRIGMINKKDFDELKVKLKELMGL
jgi:mRNA-degrading endonuclease toxin of MazEF toxin-antitoxin module